MCGIDTRLGVENQIEQHNKLVDRRGPDATKTIIFNDGPLVISFTSSTLHLRGDALVIQPLEDENYILQWNGEIYGGIQVNVHENDTKCLFDAIKNGSLTRLLDGILGEFAFVLFDKKSKRLYYGRDRFGRRSLLQSTTRTNKNLHLCSVAPPHAGHCDYEEVPAEGIFIIDLSLEKFHSHLLWPWSTLAANNNEINTIKANQPLPTNDLEKRFAFYLQQSISRRVLNIPSLLTNDNSPLAILFSGGVDSVLLAAMVDQILPSKVPIDLLNVAFANQRFAKEAEKSGKSIFDVPDRIAGLNAYYELLKINSNRRWNFIKCNVERPEYEQAKEKVVQLLKPTNTVMDLSIGIALWFAARGQGTTIDGLAFKSNAKVIIVGMGADEQLGGYSRHRSAFQNGGYPAVQQEMQQQLNRIWLRNMGRDDRCISDHGKEARFPFLDEDLVSFLISLPAEYKCDFSLPKGQGEKFLLRKLVKSVGFSESVAFLPKRAIQFGAKTAKLDGTDDGAALLPNL